jgi:metal-responsive CopG/Arc/MetJ family transcriptional regulator
MEVNSMKITINMPDDLLKDVDERAKSMYLSRSSFINMALSQRLQQDKVLDNVPEMLQALRDVKNVVDKQND